MTEATQATRSPLHVFVRRAGFALVLMALMLVPSFALMAATKQPAATYAAMGAIIGAVAVAAGGVRIGVLTAVIASALAPLSIIAGLTPLTGAFLMALMTLTVGRMARFGLHRAIVLVPIFLAWTTLSPVPWVNHEDLAKVNALLVKKGLTISQALDRLHPSKGSSSAGLSKVLSHAAIELRMNQTYLAWVAAFFFLGAIIAVAVLPLLLRKAPRPAPVTHSRHEAMPYTITITLLTAVATFYFLNHPKLTGGAFMVAAILVLAQVGTDIQWKLAIQRVLGTLGGVVLLTIVVALLGGGSYVKLFGLPFPANLYLVGIVFGMFAIIMKFSPRQWIYYILITPTAALLNAYTTKEASHLGTARLVDNLVGALLVVLAALITLGAARLTGGDNEEEPATPEDAAAAI